MKIDKLIKYRNLIIYNPHVLRCTFLSTYNIDVRAGRIPGKVIKDLREQLTISLWLMVYLHSQSPSWPPGSLFVQTLPGMARVGPSVGNSQLKPPELTVGMDSDPENVTNSINKLCVFDTMRCA